MNNNREKKYYLDLPKNALVILVGIPGSGKSTWAKSIAKDYTTIVSTDDINEELNGKMVGETLPNTPEIFEEFYKRIRAGLEDGKQVIADATSVSRYKRKDLYDIAKEYAVPIRVVVMKTSLEQSLKQNKQRIRYVPDNKVRMSFEQIRYGVLKWHRKLEGEQIGELKEDNLRPGDEEYYQYLWNHGINTGKDKEERYPSEFKRIGWEIDDLRKEGYNAKEIIISQRPQKENER